MGTQARMQRGKDAEMEEGMVGWGCGQGEGGRGKGREGGREGELRSVLHDRNPANPPGNQSVASILVQGMSQLPTSLDNNVFHHGYPRYQLS